MKNNSNKTLLTIAYYGCVVVMLALVVTLIIGLLRTNVALWIRICYIAIACLLVGLVIYDCVCINSGMSTYVAGFIMFALTVATVIVCFVLYSRLTITNGLVPTADFSLYLFEIGNLIAINILTIIIYCIGNFYTKHDNKNTIRTKI